MRARGASPLSTEESRSKLPAVRSRVLGATASRPFSKSDSGASIAPPSIPELVCSEMRSWIASGELRPGPLNISELARHFGVSGVPIREALRTLEAEGFVRFDRNRSVQVNELSVQGLHEIYRIRLLLEPTLMREATPLIQLDRERLSRLDKLARQMSSKETDLAAWAKANAAFHWEIYEASPMPRMKSILSSLLAAVEPFVRLSVGDVDALASRANGAPATPPLSTTVMQKPGLTSSSSTFWQRFG